MIAAVFTPLIWAAGFYTAALIVHELWASADKIAAALNFEPIPGSARHGR
jgi:sulfur carrier protein ThiS